jgi:Ca-activated chloride channel family protein
MHSGNLRRAAATLVFITLTFGASSALAQGVHVLPHPDHPHPHAIYLASAGLKLDIRGGVAHVTQTQVFANPNGWQAEGIYLFPLPEGAAVTDFRLTMDGVPVRGEVLDREKARGIYLDIVRRIKDPALMEWVGHRVFQARIFPFEPNGERTLTLAYSYVLPREGDFLAFKYLTGQGSMHDMQMLQTVPERPIPPNVQPQRPDPRMQRVAPERRAARFTIEGTIRSDRPLRSVYSPTHPLDLVQDEEGMAEFTAEGVLHDRQGFSLYYAVSEDRDVGMSLLTHRPPGEDGFFLLSISPGWQNGRARMAKNLIFVLDTSGSMQGDGKLEQAIEALVFGLGTLGPEDRFGIISYSSTVRSWREGLSTADRGTVRDARQYAEGLSAAGGTNIEGALAMAADMARRAASERNGSAPTYVIFLTDGLPTVGEQNPDVLLSMSGDRIPERARLFTWGVGYDVNAFLLDRLAEDHGGTSAYVEPFEDLEVKVSGFFDQISVPVLANLELNIRGAGAYDMFPAELPDLFRGGRITVMGRFRGSGEIEMRLTGMQGDRERRIASRARLPRREHDAGFLSSMWAQRKVGYLLEQIRLHGESEELKKEIIGLGEQYGLVTPYTAYLVIEDQMRITEEMEADAVAAPAETAFRAIARDARRGRESSMYAGAAGNRQQTGDMAIQLSKAEKALQDAESFRQANYLRVQRVEEKTFHLDETTGIWRDAALKADQEVEQILVGSDDFIKLLEKHEGLSRWSAIGQTVEVLLDGTGYQIQIPKLDPK